MQYWSTDSHTRQRRRLWLCLFFVPHVGAIPTSWLTVRPDLAKFSYFGKILKVFGKFLRVYLVFGTIFNLLWQFFYILGQFFIIDNKQISRKWSYQLVTLMTNYLVPISTMLWKSLSVGNCVVSPKIWLCTKKCQTKIVSCVRTSFTEC